MVAMSAEEGGRPSQVTVAGWAVAVVSVFLVVSVFDAMGNLHSVDTREAVTRTLTKGWAKGSGVSVDDALAAMRWGLFVSGAAGAAAAILGVFVLQRNKAARIGLSVAALAMLLVTPLTGSFLSVLVAGTTALLWTGPSADWFAGRPIRQRTPVRREPPRTPPSFPSDAPAAPPVAWVPPADHAPGAPGPSPTPAPTPAPTPGWGQAPAPAAPPAGYPQWPAQNPVQSPAQPPPWPQPPVHPAWPAARADDGLPMPRQVRIACILTWVFSAVTGLAYAALLAALAIDEPGLIKAMEDSPSWRSSYDEKTVVTAAVVAGVLFLLWCIGAAVLAWFAWRRASWAWIVLCVSTSLAALICLIAVPYSLVHLAATAYALAMLLGRRSREWYAGR